jgi:DNA-binding CsgD family transcriptional regulator
MGNHALARSLIEESLALSREVGDKERLAFSLLVLVHTSLKSANQGEYTRVHSQLKESLALFRELSNKEGIAWSQHFLGVLNLQQDDTTTAHTLFEESLALFRAVGSRQFIAHPLYYLGKVAARQGDLPRAHAFYKESLAMFKEVDDSRGIAACLEGWGGVVARQGAPVWAAQLWGAAEVLREAHGSFDPFTLFTMPGERADYEPMRAAVRAQLGEQAFAQTLARGRTMTPEQALAAQAPSMLSNHPSAPSDTKARTAQSKRAAPPSADGLTEREVEVLRLLAQGLTDAQIAQALVISPRTVNAHLRSIYSKLGLTSRHALEHHLV